MAQRSNPLPNNPNTSSANDEVYMRRALQLASNGLGTVSPNPLVGCVIVRNGQIIGEGWHQTYGKAHAEVNAVASVKDKALLAESTLYVTLEPCAHTGKTPPCADLIIRHAIPKVVICNRDPFDQVDGKGIERLRQHGIEVITGVCEAEGRHLNRRFFTFIERKRPYVLLKWAQTADGFVGRENFDSKWISNEQSRRQVHKMRADEDAILVGYHTALYDNPRLTTRDWEGKNPLRIVLDPEMALSKSLHLFSDGLPTLCFNKKQTVTDGATRWVKIPFEHPEQELLTHLHHEGIQSLIVEGGAATLQGFIRSSAWDEAHIFTSTAIFERGIAAPTLDGRLADQQRIGTDTLSIYHHG